MTGERTDYARALFGVLALDYPGLESVKVAVEAEDWQRAEVAYLDFSRNVERPRLYWNPHGEDRFELRSAAWDFFSEDPGGVTWADRQRVQGLISRQKGFTHTRTQGVKPSPYTLVELADMLLENKVFMPGSPEDGVQDLGSEWNWEHQPVGGTGQRWTLSLAYQYFHRCLGQAYWLSGDERYVAKLAALAVDYVAYVDQRSDWIWIPDMQLALNYQQVTPFILSWQGLAARDFCAIEGWLATGCAASMEAVEEAPGNQLLYNGLGLLWLGIGLPQCRRAPQWRQRGFAQLSAYFGAGASYPDGASYENAYGYVVGASFSGLKAMQMAQENGWECPKGLVRGLERRGAFLAAVTKPDGTCVWSGDGQRGRPLGFVGEVAKLAQRPDLEYVASGGNSGSAPTQRSVYFPHGGVGVMGGGWGRGENYLYFDAGPLGAVHGHEGKLAIEVVAWGRSLVEDLGIHSYSREAQELPWYRFFGQTAGHNSVTVDGQSQMRLVSGPRVGEGEQDNLWRTSPRWDFMVGHYREGYGAGHYTEPMASVFAPEEWQGPIDRSVQHRRSVLFVKGQQPGDPEYWIVTDWLVGSGEHTCEQLFHFVPVEVGVDAAAKTVVTLSEGQANLALLAAVVAGIKLEVVEGQTEPTLQGWYCGGELRPVPAPCAVFRQRGPLPQLFQTVLWPQRPGETALPRVESLGGGWVRVALPGGGWDIHCAPRRPGFYRLGEWHFFGAGFWARQGPAGDIFAEETIDG